MTTNYRTCAESDFFDELLHHLELFTSTTGGHPYVSYVSLLLRNRIAALKPAERQPTGTQQANHDICPEHDIFTVICENHEPLRIHACLCEGKRS